MTMRSGWDAVLWLLVRGTTNAIKCDQMQTNDFVEVPIGRQLCGKLGNKSYKLYECESCSCDNMRYESEETELMF